MSPSLDPIVSLMQTSPRFDRQVIAVTGASKGIGRALALELGRRGAIVILIARDLSALESLYDAILEAGGAEPVIVPCDFKTLDANTALELAELIGGEFGRLDGLVHMGAIMGGREPIQTHRPDHWANVIQINLNAVFYLTQALLPLLEQSTAGRIVMATSSVGYNVQAYWGAYAVSKAGLEMLTGMLAQELENTSKTRVLTVNPGGTRTAMRAEAKPGEDPTSLPPPELVLDAFLFGLCNEAEAFHGQRINARDLMAALQIWPAS